MGGEIHRLPLRVRPRTGEPAYGFFGRLAARNGFETCSGLGRLVGLRYHGDVLTGARLEDIARLGGMDPAFLAATTVRYRPRGKIMLAGQTLRPLHWAARARRYCPACLRHEARHLDGPVPFRPFRRFWWDVTFVETCPIHCVGLLRECPRCEQPISVDDPLAWRCRCGGDLRFAKPQPVPASKCLFDRYIGGRLGACRPVQIPVLDAMPLDVAAAAIFYVGWAKLFGLQEPPIKPENIEQAQARLAGLDVFRGWPDAYIKLLDDLLSNGPVQRRRIGPRAYGALGRWLLRHRNPEAVSPMLAVLMSHTDRCGLVQDTTVPLNKAAQNCGMPQRRVFTILKERGLADQQATFERSLRSFPVPRDCLDGLLRTSANELHQPAAAEYLGVSPHAIRRLIRLGIVPIAPKDKRWGGSSGVLRSEIDALVERFVNNAPLVGEIPEHTIPLSRAAMHWAVPIEEIIAALFAQTLRPIARLVQETGFKAVLLPRDAGLDIRSAPVDSVAIEQAAPLCGVSGEVLLAFVRDGLIPSQQARGYRMLGTRIKVADCHHFRATYASQWELIRRFGTSEQKLRTLLKAEGVEPVAQPPRCRATIYRRGEAERTLTRFFDSVRLSRPVSGRAARSLLRTGRHNAKT